MLPTSVVVDGLEPKQHFQLPNCLSSTLCWCWRPNFFMVQSGVLPTNFWQHVGGPACMVHHNIYTNRARRALIHECYYSRGVNSTSMKNSMLPTRDCIRKPNGES